MSSTVSRRVRFVRAIFLATLFGLGALEAQQTTITLSSSPNPVVFGQNVTLTATVAPATASGNVTFYDGTSLVGIGALGGGKATFATSLLPSGTRFLKAYYGGGTGLAVSTSAVLSQSVNAVPAGTFGAPVNYPVGSGLMGIALGDFNGDGKMDLAVANYGGNVEILLGNGDGTFRTAVAYSAGVNPVAVAVGDFNGDGKMDLAVANYGGSVSVLLGNGDGTFQAALNDNVGAGLSALAVGDFNGDGKADVVVANGLYGAVSVLLGKGDGTLQTPLNLTVGSGSTSVAIGDFNGDGKPDLAVADLRSNDINVLLGKGDGTFQAAVSVAANSGPVSLAVGDFNGDGKSDLAVVGQFVSVLLGKGDGTFQTAVNYAAGSGLQSVALGDFNGDGRADIAVVSQTSGNVSVLGGNGDGTFQQAVNYAIGGAPRWLVVGEFNGDGRDDLAISDAGGNLRVVLGGGPVGSTVSLTSSMNPATLGENVTLTAFLSPGATGSVTFYDGASMLGIGTAANGQASFTTSLLPFGTGPLKAYYSGNLEYAASTSAVLTETVNALASNGFQAPVYYGLPSPATFVAVGDFNGDGKADLAVNSSDGQVSVLLGNGDGTFRAPVSTNVTASSFAVGDFNGDGHSDLAVLVVGGFYPALVYSVTILLGNGDGTFRFSTPYSYPICSGANWIAVSDFNGDGKADIAVGCSYGVAVMLGNGDGTLQPYKASPIIDIAFPVEQIAVGDFNGDGKPDVAVISGSLCILLGNGDGTFVPQVGYSYFAGINPWSIAVGDFNGDGKADIVVADTSGDPVPPNDTASVLLGNGDGTFQAATLYPGGTERALVQVGDFNGDGRADILLLAGDKTSVLFGNGDGTFQLPTFYLASGEWAVVGDFNGDGRTDIAITYGVMLGTLAPPAGVKLLTPGTKVGVFRNGVSFLEDSNGNGVYDAGVDHYIPDFTGPGGYQKGDTPIVGDWTGDGLSKVGIYRTSTGTWYLDANNDGVYDAGDYTYQFGGLAGDVPVAGDWGGVGRSCVGIYRSPTSMWMLDLNCNGVFENTPTDAFFPFGGLAGDVPVVGNWTGGTTRVGVVRAYAPNGVPQGSPFYWVFDNSDAYAGNSPANHPPAPGAFAFGGLPGDVFVTGDWNNSGAAKAGVFRSGAAGAQAFQWVLDYNGLHTPDLVFNLFGLAGDMPVTGRW